MGSCNPILSKETCPGQQSPVESFEMALLDNFFFLHLFLALASAQWWGLQGGFRPRVPSVDISPGRLGAQRGIGVPKQPGGFFRASSRNFFQGSSNYGSSRFGPRPASASSESSDGNRLTSNLSSIKLTSSSSKSSPSNEVVATRTSKKGFDGLSGIDQKNKVEKEKGVEKVKVTRGWLVPPSLKALPAVPGAPQSEGSVALQCQSKTPDGSQTEEGNQYEKFMPVPAVPNSATDLQASRRPKDSLASVDLNVSPLNIVAVKPSKVSTDPPRPISARPTTSRRPASPRPTTPRPTSPTRPAPVVPQQSLPSEDDKTEIRKKFKRCHGRCVQKQCLPVANLEVYYKCVDKCKQLCTP